MKYVSSKLLAVAFVWLLVASMFAGVMPVAAATTWTVNGSGGAGFTSIQAAVNAASAGDTIIVRDGTYNENVNVNKPYLTVKSDNGADTTIVQAANSDDHVFEVTAGYVNISGFTVNGATEDGNAGIYLNGVEHCIISDNTASNNNGIFLSSSSYNTLTDNTVNSNNLYGIYLYHSSNNTLTNNTASDNQYGIYLSSSSNNTLTNNTASTNGHGIYLSSSSNNTLTGNTASDNTEFSNSRGISLSFSSNNAIQGNTASNNGDGIYLYHSSNNTLTNNNANLNYENGIYLYHSSNNTLTGNTASDNSDDGIYLYSSSNNTLTGNTAVNNNDANIHLYSSSYNTLTNNTASGDWYGISLRRSSNNTLTNNTASGGCNYISISLWYSSNNTLTGNIMSDNDWNFGVYGSSLSHYTHNIDTTNKVNGKPVYYWIDKQDQKIPDDAGYVGVVDSNNITVEDLTLGGNGQGVLFAYTDNSKIKNVNASNNYDGIYLWESSNNTLQGNTANSNNGRGIYLRESSNNTLADNTASNNYLGGICLDRSSNNILTNNTANSNYDYGIYLRDSSNNNKIYLNDFINNGENVYSEDSSTNIWNSTEKITYTYDGSEFENYLGNYWDDYTGSDTDGDGIGDNPYGIDGDEDGYPLVEGFENYNIMTTPPENQPPNPPTKLQKVIQQQEKETRVITVNGVEYYIVTLKRYINPETWEPSDHSFFADKPPAWKVYTYSNYQPISDKEEEELKELLRSIWTVDRANTLVKRVGSPENISDTIMVIDEVIDASQGLSDANYLTVWCKTEVFKTLDFVIYAELGLPITDLGLGTIIEEQLDYYTDPERFLKEAGRACLDASKANYSQAREIAEVHQDGFSDYTTAKDYLNYYYNGQFKRSYGIALALPTGEISENAFWEIAGWVPEYINHLGPKVTSGVNKFFIIGELIVEVVKVAKNLEATMGESRDYNNKLKEIEEETIQLFEHESFPVDYTLALLNQDSDPLYKKWGIHGIDHINYNFCSPGELRVNDSQGRVTGLVNGEVRMEIPNSYYFYSSHTVTIFFQNDSYAAKVVGTDTGTYGLDISAVEDGEANMFAVTNFSTTNKTTHQYTINWSTHIATVQIDADGDGEFEETITIQPPIVNFTFTPQNPTVNQHITFDASASYDPDGTITNYEWNFGDGNITDTTNPIITHSYSSAGEYSVTLILTDNSGALNSTTKIITIPDITPPKSITNLMNTTGQTWINWTWINPIDADFDHTMVYLDGVWQTNTSDSFYNVTTLNPDSYYKIATHTVDKSGNVNETWVNQTTKTNENQPPSPPTGFIAEPKDHMINLSWTNPSDPDFVGTMIRYRTDIFPENETDGELICDRPAQAGSSDSFSHQGLNTSKDYYYTAFAYDGGPKYSAGVVAPAAVSPVPELQTIILISCGMIAIAGYIHFCKKRE